MPPVSAKRRSSASRLCSRRAAFQESVMLVWVGLLEARPVGVLGGVVSVQAVVVVLMLVCEVEWLPAASYASTASV